MEKITYRKTLDVHKGGIQFTLQGFETADKLSRVIEISLMASGDAIDFPLEGIAAVMYVKTPSVEKPNRIECDIKDNKIIYNVLPITEEGTTIMQLKLIETSPGASVLYSPKFAVEVSKSEGDVINEVGSETFTLLEKTMSNAATAYNARITNFNLGSDGVIKITYGDGSEYTSDFLKRINLGDNAILAESYAKGDTGTRSGEETDNAQYYSNIAKSEACNAKRIMEDGVEILEEVKLHGVYTAFSVDFTSGTLTYSSPKYNFKINKYTGELEVIGKSYDMEGNLIEIIKSWFEAKIDSNGHFWSGMTFEEFIEYVYCSGDGVSLLNDRVYNIEQIQNNTTSKEAEFEQRISSAESTLVTHMNDISVINSILSGLSGEVVWENTENELDTTTFYLDLSKYKSFRIIYALKRNGEFSEMTMTGRGTFSIHGIDVYRDITITDEYIKITEAYFGFEDGTTQLLPKRIIGYIY